jgi:hypothetical protein
MVQGIPEYIIIKIKFEEKWSPYKTYFETGLSKEPWSSKKFVHDPSTLCAHFP